MIGVLSTPVFFIVMIRSRYALTLSENARLSADTVFIILPHVLTQKEIASKVKAELQDLLGKGKIRNYNVSPKLYISMSVIRPISSNVTYPNS
jgi:hypothetical protein